MRETKIRSSSISREEQYARLLSPVILEYNGESQYLARDDRKDLISIGDGQGNKFGQFLSQKRRESSAWKQMPGSLAVLLCMGLPVFPRMAQSESAPLRNGKLPSTREAFGPFPNSVGQQVEGVYKYSLCADARIGVVDFAVCPR